MPTPFTHLAKAEQLLHDPTLPDEGHALLERYWGPFLLGSIVADGHHLAAGLKRADTHFFVYQPHIDPPAESTMLEQYPQLCYADLGATAQAVFIAGYLGHLAVDVVWCEDVIFPYFWGADYGNPAYRHFLFTTLIAFMDQRDYATLPTSHKTALYDTVPLDWLPFLPDTAILAWRNRVAEQLKPDGEPETLAILNRTIQAGYDLTEMLYSPQVMQDQLWNRYSLEQLATAEAKAYARMLSVVCNYLKL